MYKIVNTFLIHNVYGAEIAAEAVIGRRVRIGHHQAIQIPPYCIIGDGCLIRHNVTIGFGGSSKDPLAVPHLGRNVKIGPGSCLLGPISVGHGVRIGPNCVVMANVPDGATVFSPPARVMKATVTDPVSPETT